MKRLTALVALYAFWMPVAGHAEDVSDILRHTANLYANLHSYTERATVQATLQAGTTTLEHYAEGVLLAAKRPNLLHLVLNFPQRTSYQAIYSDGKTLTLYNSGLNQYIAVPTAPSFKQLLPLLHKRARISFMPSPLYLFSDPSLLTSLRDFKQEADQAINGHACYVISALAPSFAAPLGQQSAPMHWTWYIDKQQGWIWQLNGVSDPITMRVQLPGHRQPEPAKVILRIEYRVLQAQIDPELKNEEFHFQPPRGATPYKGSHPPQMRKRAP